MSTPWDFEYSFKTCPALVGGTLASCLLNGTPWQWHPAAAAKGPHPMLWEHTTSFVTLVYWWPFPLLYWWYWSIPLFFALQMICAELGEGLHNFFFFFFEEFSPSLLILSLLNSFFLCINRWFLLFSPSLRNQGYYFAKGLSQSLLAYFVKFSVDLCPKVFHLLLCLFGNLFSQPVLLFDFKHL